MSESYEVISAYPGVVGDQANWLVNGEGSDHPRELHIPIVALRGRDVVMLRGDNPRDLALPALHFYSDDHPLVPPNNDRLFMDGRYLRVQRSVDAYVKRGLLPRRNIQPFEIRFMECWKAISRDVPQPIIVGPASLTTARSMVSIKHLPFLVELTNDQELNEFAPDGRSIVPSPIQPITELLDTLVGINRVPDELLDAQQLLHRLTTLPKRRGS